MSERTPIEAILQEAGIDPRAATAGERRLAQWLHEARVAHEQAQDGWFKEAQASAEASTYFDEDRPTN